MTDLEINRTEIRKWATATLKAADALHVIPTPIDDVRRAIDLTSAHELEALANDMPHDLWRRMRALGAKLRGALASRERIVYIDPNLGHTQARFVTGHEIGHDVLPWQKDAYQADTDATLSASVRDHFEREANIFSSDLLFNVDELEYRATGAPLSLITPLGFHKDFDASLIATTRRFIEEHKSSCALLVLGRYPTRSLGAPGSAILYGVQSRKFEGQHGPVCRGLRLPNAWPNRYHDLAAACFDAVTGHGPPLRHGLYTSVTNTEFRYEVYAARPYPFVLLTPRRPFVRANKTQVAWLSEPEPSGVSTLPVHPPTAHQAATAARGLVFTPSRFGLRNKR